MKSILRFSLLLSSGPRGALRPARLLQGLQGQETDWEFLFSEDSSEDRRPGTGVSQEVSEKSQQPPTVHSRDPRGGGERMEGTPLKTAGACFIAKSSPKAPPGAQGAPSRRAATAGRRNLLCARPWGWRLRVLPSLPAVTLGLSPFSR